MTPHRDPADRPLRATRALAHPLWWVALALLAANDHLFKGAGVLPAALTGKLSDFAGLLVAPVVLAALIGVRGRRGWMLCHLAVGLGFSAINLSPAFARVVEAATLPTPFPWWITVDPGDLIALPMLAVSALLFGAWCRRPVALRPAFARLGLALGGLACVATSPPDEQPPIGPEPWPEDVEFSESAGRIGLVNTTDGALVLRTRALRPTVTVDCAAVARDPAQHLTPDLFGPVVLWSLEPGTLLTDGQIDDGRGRECRVALVSTVRRTHLLFIDPRQHPLRDLRHEVGAPLTDSALIGITGSAEAPTLDAHPTLFGPPRGEPLDPDPACGAREPGAGLAWTEPPMGPSLIVDHSVGPDGCHAFDIADRRIIERDPEAEPPTLRWYVCAPGAPLDLPVGTELTLYGTAAESGAARVEIVTGDRTIELLRIVQITRDSVGLDQIRVAAPTSDDACRSVWRDGCGGIMSPLVLHDAEGPLPVGEPARIGDDRTITVIRAQQAQVSDAECDPWGAVGARFELVIDTLHDDVAPEAAE